MKHVKTILFINVLLYSISLSFLFLYWIYGVLDSFKMDIFYNIPVLSLLSYGLGYVLTGNTDDSSI